MIETILMVWFAGYVLWLLSLIPLGWFKKEAASTTLLYAIFPFILILGIVFVIFIVPLMVVFSKDFREHVIIERARKEQSRFINQGDF